MNARDRSTTPVRRKPLRVATLFVATLCGLWMSALSAAPVCVEAAPNPAPQLAAPQSSANGGIGGTGAVAEGGIGGTGIVAKGGIGGTGAVASGGIGGTGIVGTVTGFASVCVNGLEVHFDPLTAVTRNGLPADIATLALGQVIAVDSARTQKGLVARHISILNALEGPVTGIAPEIGMIQVMGKPVHVDESTRLGGLSTLAEARPGMSLRVAGFRDAGGDVYATRIEAAPGLADASAIGVLVRHAGGETSLEGMTVHFATTLPSTAGEMLLRGRWDGGALVAREAHPDPSLPFAGHADQVVAEGLILQHREPARLRIGGFEVELSAATHVAGISDNKLAEGQRIRVSGRLEGRNHIVAQRIEIERPPLHLRPLSAPAPRKHDAGFMSGCEGCQPAERTGMAERAGRPDRPQRMERLEHIPRPRMDRPAGAGMPGMRK